MGLRYYPMQDAPKDEDIQLLIPWTQPQWTVGQWCDVGSCWRYHGDDGPQDIAPIGWLFLSDVPRKP